PGISTLGGRIRDAGPKCQGVLEKRHGTRDTRHEKNPDLLSCLVSRVPLLFFPVPPPRIQSPPPAGGHIMDLSNARAAVLVEQQDKALEVGYPYPRLKEAGSQVPRVGPEAGQTYPSKLGYPAKSDKAAKDCTPDDFDLLVTPGGFAPDFIRRSEPM